MSAPQPAAVVVLAAGQGTRMHSAVPKVLHTLAGRSLLAHALAAVRPLRAGRVLVVVGHGREQVAAAASERLPGVVAVVQEPQRGTGHAARVALEAAGPLDGTVLVVPADAPLLGSDTLRALLDRHAEAGAAATLLTAHQADPTGYGRVLRRDGAPVAVVEERDADERVRAITEVATSVYAFDAAALREQLSRLSAANAQGEEYLTDVIAGLAAAGRPVAAVTADAAEVIGVNDRVQLAEAARLLNARLLRAHMLAGVTVLDPATTWVDVTVQLAPDAVLEGNTRLRGATAVAAGAQVGPNCTLVDTAVGLGARVRDSVCSGAEIGAGASVGPFCYLRPGARLGPDAKAGAYVEIKAAVVGAGAKVPHLSYVGDAEIGAGTNIGAATVFVNYDGVAKHRTVVGRDARVGSDTMLVAPVTVGDGAYTAAGSVVDQDVPPGALAIGRARQRNVEGWVARRRPGTPADAAAREAAARDGEAR